MADRYWVGGAGTWDSTTTTNWSATSGGAGGASVPTSVDNAIFNSASYPSGAVTITMGTSQSCLNLTVSAPSVTFTFSGVGTNSFLSIYGSLTLQATTVWSWTGSISFRSTTTGNTINTNNVSIASYFSFNGVGGYWTLGSAFNAANGIQLQAGTLDTSASNYALSAGGSYGLTIALNSLAKAVNLNASNVSVSTLSNNSQANLTWNAGTSTITFGVGYTGGTLYTSSNMTLYNVVLNPSSNYATINGAFTFNNLTFYPSSSYKVHQVFLLSSIIINGRLYSASAAGADPSLRTLFASFYKGTPVTITAANVSLYDTDFDEIIGAGAATWSGTRLGNCGGNSNITFPAAKTVYYSAATAGAWSAANWATISGGTAAATNFPLPQDTVIIDNNSGTGTLNVDMDYTIGTLNAADRTTALTLQLSAYDTSQLGGNSRFIGNFTISSNVTVTNTSGGALSFTGRSTQVITTNNASITAPITIYSSGTVQLANNITNNYATSFGLTLYSGTLDLNDKTLTVSRVYMQGVLPKTIAFGTDSTLIVTGSGTQAYYDNSSYLPGTFTRSISITGVGTISMTSASSKYFAGTAFIDYSGITIDQAGAGILGITGNGTQFANITNSYSTTGATTIQLLGTIYVNRFTASGTAGKLLTLQLATLSCYTGIVSVDYMNIAGNKAQGGAKWYAGANSIDSGSNRGWIFTAPPSNNFMFLLLGLP